MKIYSKSREDNYEIIVDWNLGNTCSLKCDYCAKVFHSGRNPFPDIANAKAFIDTFIEKRRGDNRTLKFSFVGGEPTEYVHLKDLCEYIKSKCFAKIHIMTNAAKDVSYWKDLSPHIDSVMMSYHHGKVTSEHFSQIATTLKQNFITVMPVFPMQPDHFDTSLGVRAELEKQGLYGQLQPLYVDHIGRTTLLNYSTKQLDILFPKTKVSDIVVEEDEAKSLGTVNDIIHAKKNCFKGMKCGIGIDQITIDHGGNIRGGWCGVGGILGNINEGVFNFPSEAFTCTKDSCDNPLDLSVPKWIE